MFSGPDHHQEGNSVWELMSPKEFYFFTIPFEMDGDTKVTASFFPSLNFNLSKSSIMYSVKRQKLHGYSHYYLNVVLMCAFCCSKICPQQSLFEKRLLHYFPAGCLKTECQILYFKHTRKAYVRNGIM